jgi:SAM-dependent methyltransferase
LEASIHIARYALARDVCRGRKVLDLACGEGYGSRLMLDWGATDVVGIDVSEETVANARARFGRDGLRYLSGDAEKVEALLAGEQFDLIISLETIEHLQNPAAYLKALTRLRAPDGEIFISCPNDWWYYPKAEQSNPYHIRKYSYDEFLALVTPVLGEPDAIALGLPVTGFINVPMKDIGPADARISQIAMMAAGESRNAFVVPVEPGSVAPGNSSYFVARWGRGGDAIAGAGILPVPMDVFRNGLYSGDFNRDVRNSAVLGGGLELVRQLQTGLQQQWGAADRSGAALQLKLDELMSATRGEWQRCLEVALQAKEADCQARLTSLSDDCERVASAREKAVLDLARATQDALQSELDGLVRDRVAQHRNRRSEAQAPVRTRAAGCGAGRERSRGPQRGDAFCRKDRTRNPAGDPSARSRRQRRRGGRPEAQAPVRARPSGGNPRRERRDGAQCRLADRREGAA